MKRAVRYILLLLVIALVGYKSVYFQKLSERKNKTAGNFDAAAFSKKLWETRLPARLDSAIELSALISAIRTNPTEAFANHSNSISIGNYRYSLVKIEGQVESIGEDEILLKAKAPGDSSIRVIIATEYIYGNAVRDASGLVNIKDFSGSNDLNNISEELNKEIRSHVLPPFKKMVKPGDRLALAGAIELNREHIRFNDVEIIPMRVKILP
jgi:predicted lipoprotein